MFSFIDLIGRRHFRFSMKNMYRHICVAHAKSVCTLSEQRSLPTPEKLMLGLGIAYFDAKLSTGPRRKETPRRTLNSNVVK